MTDSDGDESGNESDVSSIADLEKYQEFDWYKEDVSLYDIIFQTDTSREVAMLESICQLYGPVHAECIDQQRREARILEPACGTGRLIVALRQLGYTVTGIDISSAMLSYTQDAVKDKGLSGPRCQLMCADMCDFKLEQQVHFAHCMVSSVKYLLSEQLLARHLLCMHSALVQGGLYVIAMHLVDYDYHKGGGERERWIEKRGHTTVDCKIFSSAPNPYTRIEHVDTYIDVHEAQHTGQGDVTTHSRFLHTAFDMRTYSCRELFNTLDSMSCLFEVAAMYDFDYDVTKGICDPRVNDDQLDVVLVLRAIK